MKICPVCQTTYNDALRFCTKDGTPLASLEQPASAQIISEPVSENVLPAPDLNIKKPSDLTPGEAQTQLPASAEIYQPMAVDNNQNDRAASKLTLIALGVLLGLGALGAAVGGALWFSSNKTQKEVAVANTNVNAVAPTPVLTNDNSSNSDAENVISNANANVDANANSNANLNANLEANSNVSLKPTPKPTPSPSATPLERNLNRNINRTTIGNSSANSISITPAARPTPSPSPNQAQRKTIVTSGGVVNGKATSLPKPAYPAIARSARASGQVQVVVLINENGNVETARAVSGPPLLRAAAESAARQARFSPTILSGQPVKVSGVIIYNFIL